MKKDSYARAGVDITLGNRVKATLPRLLASTRRPEVIGKVGGFGGLFALAKDRYQEPVLVSSVDGVGTKLKVAFLTGRHHTIGQDLVNHCVNDIAVIGAQPLFFLDYIGTSTLDPRVFRDIIKGFALACAQNGCALIGGETAQMPGFYAAGEYDVSGTIVGVVERKRMIDGKSIRPGDAIVGLASNGLHTNGYSLARKIIFDSLGLEVNQKLPGTRVRVGDELLKVHVSYGRLIQKLIGKHGSGKKGIKGIAHITGGGFIDNIPRILPANCDARIQLESWEMPPVFRLLQQFGGTSEEELYRVFNMGIGMTLIVERGMASKIVAQSSRAGHPAWIIGEIAKGRGVTKLH